MGHKALHHCGEAETRLGKGRDSPKRSGHGDAGSTVGLPAVEKKHDEWRLPAKLSRIDGLAERVRLKWSWD